MNTDNFTSINEGDMAGRTLKRTVIAVAVITAIVSFRLFHIERYLTLSYIKESRTKFETLYSERPVPVIAAYALIYVLVTSLSLPGAAVLTIAGGGLFGILTGTVVVSFASSMGAVISCALSRFVLRDWVRKRFGDKLRTVDEGVKREGAFYLFSLRLIPVFPFWLINLIMGLTDMPIRTFYFVSQIGMLPGTVVYVNAGRELSKVNSLAGILSARLIFSFVLLGLFPITAKKILARYRPAGRI